MPGTGVSFDAAVVTIAKVATEETGYVWTTNSEKLPNGKVKGSVILRAIAGSTRAYNFVFQESGMTSCRSCSS